MVPETGSKGAIAAVQEKKFAVTDWADLLSAALAEQKANSLDSGTF